MIEAAQVKARGMDIPMSITVIDESGHLKAFARMDGTRLITLGVAQDKAYSSACSGRATHEWYEFLKSDPVLDRGIAGIPRLMMVGGGYPIQPGEDVIGGIGVSGGHYNQDMACARAAWSCGSKMREGWKP